MNEKKIKNFQLTQTVELRHYKLIIKHLSVTSMLNQVWRGQK
jgi:hypothetical protein